MTMARSPLRITRAQEARSRFLLRGQHVVLAAAGVDQHAERDRKVGLRGKIGNFLELAILEDLKVILC